MSTTTGYELIGVEIADGVGTLTLNQPDKLNAWSRDMGREILEALDALGANDEVRALMITGAGRAFSSGADLTAGSSFTADGKPDVKAALTEIYNPAIIAVREIPKPVVAAVNGPAVGVSCSLALACDLVVAAESAYFLLAFINIGLVPDGGASAFVPARAGAARASEMAMLGERIAAPQALEWGLCNRVVADDELAAEAGALAARLAKGPTVAYANNKRLINASVYPNLAAQLALEADLQQEQAATEDFMIGAMAFASKTEPEFKGC